MLEGVQVLWPEYETYDKLMDIKATMMNDERFNCEKDSKLAVKPGAVSGAGLYYQV